MHNLLSILSGLLTPVIAVLTIFIAWKQWATAHNQFRLHLFDRRVQIYEAAVRLCETIVQEGETSKADVRRFCVDARAARWLFDREISEHLNKLAREAFMLMAPPGIEKSPERVKWFLEQSDTLPDKFEKYLKVRG